MTELVKSLCISQEKIKELEEKQKKEAKMPTSTLDWFASEILAMDQILICGYLEILGRRKNFDCYKKEGFYDGRNFDRSFWNLCKNEIFVPKNARAAIKIKVSNTDEISILNIPTKEIKFVIFKKFAVVKSENVILIFTNFGEFIHAGNYESWINGKLDMGHGIKEYRENVDSEIINFFEKNKEMIEKI